MVDLIASGYSEQAAYENALSALLQVLPYEGDSVRPLINHFRQKLEQLQGLPHGALIQDVPQDPAPGTVPRWFYNPVSGWVNSADTESPNPAGASQAGENR